MNFRQYIKKWSIKITTDLSIPNSGITDITGIDEEYPLVERLYIGDNKITDFSPIKNLTKLKELGLRNTGLSVLPDMSKLTDLQELYLHRNMISDVSVLSDNVNIIYLVLSNNKISDISCLKKLTLLQRFEIDDNIITDISVVRNFKSITTFVHHGNGLDKIYGELFSGRIVNNSIVNTIPEMMRILDRHHRLKTIKSLI